MSKPRISTHTTVYIDKDVNNVVLWSLQWHLIRTWCVHQHVRHALITAQTRAGGGEQNSGDGGQETDGGQQGGDAGQPSGDDGQQGG